MLTDTEQNNTKDIKEKQLLCLQAPSKMAVGRLEQSCILVDFSKKITSYNEKRETEQ